MLDEYEQFARIEEETLTRFRDRREGRGLLMSQSGQAGGNRLWIRYGENIVLAPSTQRQERLRDRIVVENGSDSIIARHGDRQQLGWFVGIIRIGDRIDDSRLRVHRNALDLARG